MSARIDSFLDEVCMHIRARSVHNAVRSELAGHIEELTDGYLAEGLSREQSEENALRDMGSSEEIGIKLNKQHRPKTEWSLIILTVVLAALGILINRSQLTGERQLMIAGLGTAALIGSVFMDYTKLRKLSLPLFAALCVIFLLTSVFCSKVQSVSVYRILGFTSMALFFTQFLLPLFAGLMVNIRTDGGIKDTVKLTALAAVVMLMSVILGRMSYLFVYLLAFGIIFITAAFNGWFKSKKMLLIPLAALAAAVAVGVNGGQFFRVCEALEVFFTGGQSDPWGAGYLTANIVSVLNSSKLVGGMEGGLPEVIETVRSEFTFAETIGKFGWIAGIAIIAVVAALLVRLFVTSVKIKGGYGRCLSLCCCALLCAKFTVNIFMNLNMLPYMGVTLPLLGMGGTDYIITMFLIGTVISVYRRNDLFPEPKIKFENI